MRGSRRVETRKKKLQWDENGGEGLVWPDAAPVFAKSRARDKRNRRKRLETKNAKDRK